MSSSLMRSDGIDLYLNTDYMEFYIPDYYFADNCKYAIDYGATIEVFGIFCVGIFEKDKLKEMKLLEIPMNLTIQSYDIEIRTVEFKSGPMKCRVMKFIKGQKIMPATYIQKSSHVVTFIKMILNGYLPLFVPYNEVYNMLLGICKMHKVNLGVPNYVLEMMISDLYRDRSDPTKKFAITYGKDSKVSDYDYQTCNIRKACQYASTFSAISFEDIDTMITASLNRSAQGKEEPFSPMEEIIKF